MIRSSRCVRPSRRVRPPASGCAGSASARHRRAPPGRPPPRASPSGRPPWPSLPSRPHRVSRRRRACGCPRDTCRVDIAERVLQRIRPRLGRDCACTSRVRRSRLSSVMPVSSAASSIARWKSRAMARMRPVNLPEPTEHHRQVLGTHHDQRDHADHQQFHPADIRHGGRLSMMCPAARSGRSGARVTRCRVRAQSAAASRRARPSRPQPSGPRRSRSLRSSPSRRA
jgi:hypothetical protein